MKEFEKRKEKRILVETDSHNCTHLPELSNLFLYLKLLKLGHWLQKRKKTRITSSIIFDLILMSVSCFFNIIKTIIILLKKLFPVVIRHLSFFTVKLINDYYFIFLSPMFLLIGFSQANIHFIYIVTKYFRNINIY